MPQAVRPVSLGPKGRRTCCSMSPRVALVIVSSLQLLFCSGLILGWAGVLLLLNGEHTFRAACDDPDLTPAGTCDESDLMLNFIFTVASTSYGAAPVLFGPLIDKCGPRVVCVLSCALLSCGFLLIAISEYPSRNLFLVGFVIIATFGVGVQLTVFHVANLFPKNHGTVTSMLSAMFGVSSMMFPLLHVLWEATDGAASRVGLFWGYTVVGLLCTSVSFFLPKRTFVLGETCAFSWRKGFHAVLEDRAANTVELVSRASVGGKQEAPSATGQDAPPPSSATNASAPTAGGAEPQFPAPETRGCGRDAKSPDFVANWTFVVLTFFSMSLYLGSVNLQVEAVDPGSSDTKGFVSAFSWIAPLGALFAPAIGVVIDKLGFAAAFWIVIALGAVHNACAAVPWLPLQVVTFLTYTLSQEAMFACMFAYIGFRFGFDNYGMLTGLVLFGCGAINLLVFPTTAAVVEGVFSFRTANLVFLGMKLVLGSLYPMYLRTEPRRSHHALLRARHKAQHDSDDEENQSHGDTTQPAPQLAGVLPP